MFFSEMTTIEQNKIISFFSKNKTMIITDIMKGRGKFSAEWVLVAQKDNQMQRWTLKPMNVVMNYYADGNVEITARGSLKVGKITMQRKGGDNGRITANMLQFKLDPTDIFDIKY